MILYNLQQRHPRALLRGFFMPTYYSIIDSVKKKAKPISIKEASLFLICLRKPIYSFISITVELFPVHPKNED